MKEMIPKKLHYCWFGGKPLNALGKRCVESWKKYFPDCEIIEWNEANFDIEGCRYAKEACTEEKWAFVSDYARCKILYEQGGIYFDTDVEVIKPFDDILAGGAFFGCENPEGCDIAVNLGVGFAVEAGHPFFRQLVEDYEKSSFYKPDGSPDLYTIVERVTELLGKYGLENRSGIQKIEGITVYPAEYFCPIDMNTGRLRITPNTHSIHRYAASWVDKGSRLRGRVYFLIVRIFGRSVGEGLRGIFGRKK